MINKLYAKAGRQALMLFFLLFAIYAAFLYQFQLKIVPLIFVILAIFMGILFIASYTYEWSSDSIRIVVGMFIYFLDIIICSFACVFCHDGYSMIIMYLFIPPIGAMAFIKIQRGLRYSVISMVCVILIFAIKYIFPYQLFFVFVPELNLGLNMIIGISSVILFCFFTYWCMKISKERQNIAIQEAVEQYAKEHKTIAEQDIATHMPKEKSANFEALYDKIVNLFEEKKPYLNPNYTIASLALNLQTNTTYISNALHSCGNTNFNAFTNLYRIAAVKEKIDNNEHKRFTMVHIFTSSGFKNQTTFNNVFKAVVGVTPSDYIKQKSNEKN